MFTTHPLLIATYFLPRRPVIVTAPCFTNAFAFRKLPGLQALSMSASLKPQSHSRQLVKEEVSNKSTTTSCVDKLSTLRPSWSLYQPFKHEVSGSNSHKTSYNRPLPSHACLSLHLQQIQESNGVLEFASAKIFQSPWFFEANHHQITEILPQTAKAPELASNSGGGLPIVTAGLPGRPGWSQKLRGSEFFAMA